MSTDRRVALDALVACPGCDLLHRRRVLDVGETSRCSRCNDVLETRKPRTVERSLAASLAGIESRISVLDAVRSLWSGDLRWLGLMTLALIVVLPLARLTMLVWVLASLQLGRPGRSGLKAAFRWSVRLEPWAMADVFMIGVAISLVKLGSVAHLEVGAAFWALCALIGVTVMIERVLCRDTVWRRLGA